MNRIYTKEHLDANTARQSLRKAKDLLIHVFIDPAEFVHKLVMEL